MNIYVYSLQCTKTRLRTIIHKKKTDNPIEKLSKRTPKWPINIWY